MNHALLGASLFPRVPTRSGKNGALRLKQVLDAVEAALITHLPRSTRDVGGHLNEALEYAVFPGGKRLRPLLVLAGAQIVSGNPTQALPAACAVEFVHASSLIIDDLPCMDDAAIRRGRPTLHQVYGEDVALLAAIALLNQAYAIFGCNRDLIREATDCIGMEGMIRGQSLDLDPHSIDNTPLSERNRKTSALMRLALVAGPIACGASRIKVDALGMAGQCFGEAYQIYDDILDRRDASEQTGKTAGQDQRHNRPSHADGCEFEDCEKRVLELTEEGHRHLLETFGPTEPVAELIRFMKRIFAARQTSPSDS